MATIVGVSGDSIKRLADYSADPDYCGGKFAVACKIAQGADIVKRTAYDVAFAACKKLGNSSSTCRNGRSGRLPVLALGTAPPQFLEVDTRTGVAVEGCRQEFLSEQNRENQSH